MAVLRYPPAKSLAAEAGRSAEPTSWPNAGPSLRVAPSGRSSERRPSRRGTTAAPHRRRDPGRPVGRTGSHPAGHGGSRLVPRSAERPASATGRVLLQHQSSRPGGHGQRETGLGALAPPPPDRPGQRVCGDGRRPLRRAGRIPPRVVVAGEPVPVRDSLDQRNRARDPADLVGLDPPAARRLGWRPGPCSIRTSWPARRSGGTRPGCPGSGAAARQPTTMSSPRRPDSWWPRWRSPGSRRALPGLMSRLACSRGTGPQYVPQRSEPRAGLRLSRPGRGARPDRGRRSRPRRAPPPDCHLAVIGPHARCSRRLPGLRAAGTTSRRQRRGPGPRDRSPRGQPLGGAPRPRAGALRRRRVVAASAAWCRQHASVGAGSATPATRSTGHPTVALRRRRDHDLPVPADRRA